MTAAPRDGRAAMGVLGAWLAVVVACQPAAPASRSPGGSPTALAARRYEPSRDLGPLFADVQLSGLFSDSKTFADARALADPVAIAARYAALRTDRAFDLRAFTTTYFDLPPPPSSALPDDAPVSMEAHIRALWPALTRGADPDDLRSSRLPLPNPYIVPGGRFREAYYWDSYFTMLGLVESRRLDLVAHMLDNFAHLVRTVGHIPNGNRTYYLSRSQPPFFATMVGLYARATDFAHAGAYLDSLETEHAFWMEGAEALLPGQAHRRVVKLSNGVTLNRYWDERSDPRPESYRVDVELGRTLPDAAQRLFYRNVRAAAESGWDFSSRWMRNPADLRTLETTELVPVDLNCILYDAEKTIAALRRARARPGDHQVAERFSALAEARRTAVQQLAFDASTGFFYDVRYRTLERITDRPTLAAAAPLYFGVATPEQARAVAARLQREFLQPGGFVTTLIASDQQWDWPNGWPPLEWLAIEGIRHYGHNDLADDARARWLSLNRTTYRATGKMTEKYDVTELGRRAGGGEYPTQDGFGWSNGVALALASQSTAMRPPDARPSPSRASSAAASTPRGGQAHMPVQYLPFGCE